MMKVDPFAGRDGRLAGMNRVASAETRHEPARTDAEPGRIVILMNPGSGRRRTPDESLVTILAGDPGIELRVLQRGTSIAQAAKQAVEEGCDVVAAAGGDGTVSEIASVLAGTGTRLGVIPLGTFNFFARSLGIPEDPKAAVEVLRTGRDTRLSLGQINGRTFINNASLGAYAAVLEARESIYARWGRSRIVAYWSVLVAMLTLFRPLRMEVTVDGQSQRMRSPMAFFAIRPYQLEEYGLLGSEEIEQGKLVLYLAPDSGRLMLLWRAIKILLRIVKPGEDYRILSGREIVIETDRSHRLVARDGEREMMPGPYEVRLLRDAVTVRVPLDDAAPQD